MRKKLSFSLLLLSVIYLYLMSPAYAALNDPTYTGVAPTSSSVQRSTGINSWSESNSSTYPFGSRIWTTRPGAYFEFTNVATDFELGFLRSNTSGVIEVYLDGNLLTTVDLYANPEIRDYTLKISSLPPTSHTVKVVVLGNSPSNNGSFAVEFWGYQHKNDPKPLQTPTGLKVNTSRNTAELTWDLVVSPVMDGYNVYIDDQLVASKIKTNKYTATVSNNVEHKYQVSSVDIYGTESPLSAPVFASYQTIPDVPVLLSADATPGQVVLTWAAATDATGYNVYRNGTKVNSSPITGTSYTVTGVPNNVINNWTVTGVNDLYESNRSNQLTTFVDTIPPGKVSFVVATPKPNQILIDWAKNPLSDNVVGYYIYRDGVRITTNPVTSGSYIMSGIPGVTYEIQVSAVDQAGNEGVKSDPVHAASLDGTPPDVPKNFKATGREGFVQLAWDQNSEPDLAGYFVYRNGVRLNITPITATNYRDLGLTYGRFYDYQVSAVDTSGNESAKSPISTAAATKPVDLTPPATPRGFFGSLSADALSIFLSWTANSEPDLAGYNLYVSTDGTSYSKINGPPVTVTDYDFSGVLGNTKYFFKISAVDTSGNESKLSAAMIMKTPSRVPNSNVTPQTPLKLLVTWQPVVGAVKYLIYYRGSLHGAVNSNVYQYEIQLAPGDDPNVERRHVEVKAQFVNGSIGQNPVPGGNAWGFTARDIFTNGLFLVGTLASFVLFGLLFKLLPRFIQIIKDAARRKGVRKA